MKLSNEQISEFIQQKRKHECHSETIKIANKLKVHADGDTPGTIISERRPGEDEEIKKYREKIFEPITTSALSKVFVELGKIRRSSDWSIKYHDSHSLIRKGESLQDYCESNYPVFESITNWVFEELLKMYLIDPNSICVVLPLSFNKQVTDYFKPIAEVVPSEHILQFLDTEYILYKSTEVGLENKEEDELYYYIDKEVIKIIVETKNDSKLQVTDYPNILGYIPAFKVPGIFHKRIGKNKVNKSRLHGMVPFLNEATREYSDLQAEVVQHIHSTMWYYSNAPCKKCNGTGKVINKMPGASTTTQSSCADCDGVGFVETSPYKQNFRITPPSNINAQSIPTPPAGYIQKDVQIVELQAKRVKEHIYDAMGVINMEYLTQVPLSQSGTAKAYDRDGANNFVHYIAEDIVRMMDKVYKLIADWRYNQLGNETTSRVDVKVLLPTITVPEKYDLFNSQIILSQIQTAKTAGVNTIVLNEMLREFTAKYFNAEPDISKMLSSMLELDPLSGYTINEKIALVGSKMVKPEDAIISTYIQLFIQQAVADDHGFLDKNSTDKRIILEGYAKKKLDEMKVSTAVKKDLGIPTGA